MINRILSGVLLFLISATAGLGAESVVLAPNPGYCSRLGEVWVVVRHKGTPEVWLDGKKVPARVTEAESIRHIKVEGIRPGGSEIRIRTGDREETLKVAGYESSGKGSTPFHTSGWNNCSGCHAYKASECRSCHAFEGHKHADYLKCDDCHKGPGVIPADASPLCSKCHKDVNIKSHKAIKHPLSSSNDPHRPGKKFDCVSCHNPHTPACLGDMKKAELQKWCKNCHAR